MTTAGTLSMPQAPTGAGEMLQLMRDGRPRTRAELIQVTGLARSTVAARVDALLALGLLAPSGEAVSTGGRPPARFAFNPDARVVLAMDVGATHALVALTDLAGTVLREKAERFDITDGPRPVLDRLVRIGRALLRSAGRRTAELAGVGVGLPGPVEHSTGRPASPPIMPGWDGYDVPAHLASGLGIDGTGLPGAGGAGRARDGARGVPVLVDNDVNIMALGEHAASHAGVEHLLFVKVATGIGAGIVSGGRLHRGAQGSAGDLGHVASPHGGDTPCTCGNTGCLEAVASVPAVVRGLRAQGVTVHDGPSLLALVRSGDVTASRALREAGREIGAVLATCVSLLNPSVIVMGGVLAGSAESLLAGVREVVYGRSLPLATGHLQIVAARTGDHAGVIGAATMVVQHVLSADEVERSIAAAL